MGSKRMDGTQKEPDKWYHEQRWRRPLREGEQYTAELLRDWLYAERLLPPDDVADDPHRNTQDANFRAALQDVADELPRAELFAVWKVARLLLLSSPDTQEQGPIFGYLRGLGASDEE